MGPVTQLTCKDCHACCHHIVIDVTARDLQREPLLLAHVERLPKGKFRLAPRKRPDGTFNYHCPFLKGWGCEIYERRPDVCVRFAEGSNKCTEARRRETKA
jgi:Fe-S-cluster containining protein